MGANQILQPLLFRPFSNDVKLKRTAKPCDCSNENVESFFLYQPSYGQELKPSAIRERVRSKALEINAVRHQVHVGAGLPQLASNIMIASHHTGCLAGTLRKNFWRHLARIFGMNAEAEARAQSHCYALCKLCRGMREIAMNSRHGRAIQTLDCFIRLARYICFCQHMHPTRQSPACSLCCNRFTCFGCENPCQRATLIKRTYFIQRESLRAPGKPAQDHHDLALTHAALRRQLSNLAARSRITGSPSRSGVVGFKEEVNASRTLAIKVSGVRSCGSMHSKKPRCAINRARISCSRTGSLRGTRMARREKESSSHTVLYPACETTTSLCA